MQPHTAHGGGHGMVDWLVRQVMDRLPYQSRAAMCLFASIARRTTNWVRYMNVEQKPLTFSLMPSKPLKGAELSEAEDLRNAALRRTPAARLDAVAVFRFDGSARVDVTCPVELRGSEYIIVDFGAVTRAEAHFAVERTGTRACPRVRIGFCEALEDWAPGGDHYHAVPGGAAQVPVVRTVTDPRAVISTPEHTYRYAVLTAARGTFRFTGAHATSTLRLAVPRKAPYPGNFRCSSPVLTRVWYAGVNTLELCTGGTPTVFLDGSSRDRLIWTGDLFVEHLVAYISNGDVETARESLRTLAKGQEPCGYVPHCGRTLCDTRTRDPAGVLVGLLTFAEYAVWYVICVWLHYWHTADATFVAEFEPVVERVMAWLCPKICAKGLMRVGPHDGQTWHVPECVMGCPTDLNCLMALALECASKLRAAAGHAPVPQWDLQRQRIAAAVNAHLWSEARGVYLNSDAADAVPTQDANTSAVWAGVAPPERAARALTYLREHCDTPFGPLTAAQPHLTMTSYISPFASFRHLLALTRAGEGEAGLRMVQRLWGHMAEADPGDVFWEKVSPAGRAEAYWHLKCPRSFTSRVHGWAAGPTHTLSTQVLGVTPRAPGYREANVRPTLGDLEWAEGVVPTPHGGIAVAWQRYGPHECRLAVRVPAGVTAHIVFPLPGVAVRRLVPGTEAAPSDGEAEVAGPVALVLATSGAPADFTF